MTQEQFDKAPLLDQILFDTTGMLVENHKDIAEAMEKYYQAKVENLGLFNIVISKPTVFEKNNLPLEIKYAFCEAIEMYHNIQAYEMGLIDKTDFINHTIAIKDKYK